MDTFVLELVYVAKHGSVELSTMSVIYAGNNAKQLIRELKKAHKEKTCWARAFRLSVWAKGKQLCYTYIPDSDVESQVVLNDLIALMNDKHKEEL